MIVNVLGRLLVQVLAEVVEGITLVKVDVVVVVKVSKGSQ